MIDIFGSGGASATATKPTTAQPTARLSGKLDIFATSQPISAPAKVANPNVPTQNFQGQQIPANIPTKNLVAYDQATGNKTFNLGNAGSGVYTEDKNGNIVKGGHTTYGGVAPVTGQQRDDIIPAGLGGTNSQAGNIKLVPNATAKLQDQIETSLSGQVKSGQIQPKAAITSALSQKAQIASQPTSLLQKVGNFFSSIPDVTKRAATQGVSLIEKSPPGALINSIVKPSPGSKQIESTLPSRNVAETVLKTLAKPLIRGFLAPGTEGLGTDIANTLLF